MTSISSLPATPAVAAAPPQASAAASSSSDDRNSFANYLKSMQGRQSDDPSNSATTLPKTFGTKDKDTKNPANTSDKKKSSTLPDPTLVPVVTPATPQAPKSFQLSWLHANNSTNGEGKSSPQSAASSGAHNTLQDDSESAKTDALKGKIAEAVSNAPVAFGANLSKQDVLRADGLKTEGAKAQEAKADDGKSKASPAQTTAAKPVAEVSKPAESKNSSGNQQHSDPSHDDSAPASGSTAKATAAAGTANEDNSAAIHAAAPSSNQMPAGPTAVQNAYTSAPAVVEKAAPVASTAAVTEPAPTPSVRPQNIELKIAGADNSQVDVRVSQRAGDVQVTVRTPDGDLAQSLRQHLPELSDRLSQAGVSGDLWQPQTAQASNSGGNDADSRYSDDAQTQQQNQQQQSRQQNQGRQQNGDTWANELNQANKESK